MNEQIHSIVQLCLNNVHDPVLLVEFQKEMGNKGETKIVVEVGEAAHKRIVYLNELRYERERASDRTRREEGDKGGAFWIQEKERGEREKGGESSRLTHFLSFFTEKCELPCKSKLTPWFKNMYVPPLLSALFCPFVFFIIFLLQKHHIFVFSRRNLCKRKRKCPPIN